MCLFPYATKRCRSSLHYRELMRTTTQRLNYFSLVTLLVELVKIVGRTIENNNDCLTLNTQKY